MDIMKIENKTRKIVVAGMGTLFFLVQSASATIVTDMENFTLIVANFSSMMTSVLNIFLQPPLLYFTVLVIFVAVIGIAKRLMHSGGKK